MEIIINIDDETTKVSVIGFKDSYQRQLDDILRSIDDVYPWYVGEGVTLFNAGGYIDNLKEYKYDFMSFNKRHTIMKKDTK